MPSDDDDLDFLCRDDRLPESGDLLFDEIDTAAATPGGGFDGTGGAVPGFGGAGAAAAAAAAAFCSGPLLAGRDGGFSFVDLELLCT